MRFEADGPDIPLDLLEARDRGEVVFLCGAGISIPAGLPSFRELARQVVKDLGVPGRDPASVLLFRALNETDPVMAPPMDQVFGILQRDYGVANVEAAVAKRLRAGRGAKLDAHRTVLKLSTNSDGVSRVITTNFDWLFERAQPRMSWVAPPALPDLTFGRTMEGITYLHGRLDSREARTGAQQGLVITTADFGRAYLAEGWATRFIRQVLDRYIIVLLGYSADDPPMRYLLEGLHAVGARSRDALYAFGEGTPAEVEARWRHRGVTAIAYSAQDHTHAELWRSLDRWSERAADPNAWRARIITQAAAGPRMLAPHERGQVTALVQSAAGAKAWAEASPPPPAEWLCVFDSYLRYAKSGRRWREDASQEFAPYRTWRLDSDPPRPTGGADGPPPGLNLLQPLPADGIGAEFAGIAVGGVPIAPLSARLRHLAWWFGRIAREPTALWWASGQRHLHPMVRRIVTSELDRHPDEPSGVAAAWRLLIEAEEASSIDEHDGYGLLQRIRSVGWTNQTLRQFGRALLPHLKWQRPLSSSSRPPEPDDPPRYIIDYDVSFFSVTVAEIVVTDEVLVPVIASWREALLHGISLLTDVQPIGWRTPTLIPEEQPGERYIDDAGGFLLRFAELFERLIAANPAAARSELQRWPSGDPFYFDKLRVWAARRADLMDGASAEGLILDLHDEAFWSGESTRELLWTLVARWDDFTQDGRIEIERRLISGPPSWEDEENADFEKRRGRQAAARLGWLLLRGCALSPTALAALSKLRAADERWRPEWDQHAADSLEGRSGTVQIDLDPRDLPNLPLAEIALEALSVERRQTHDFTRPEPFRGLLEARPARALSALTYEARHGRYPVQLWSTLLDSQQPVRSERLARAMAGRLGKLPQHVLVELRFSSTRWLERNIGPVSSLGVLNAWKAWDALLAALRTGGPEATKSGIGHTYVRGEPLQLSRRTYEMAINGPVGALTTAALALVEPCRLAGEGLADELRSRLAAAFDMPGEGADNAVSVAFRDLIYLDGVDHSYVVDVLVPMLDPGRVEAEPAWSGYLGGQYVAAPELFRHMRSSFLRAFSHSADWRWPDRRGHNLSEFLMIMLLDAQPRRYLTMAQARTALQDGGEPACLGALHALSRRMSDRANWLRVRQIIRSVWPKEERLQTRATSHVFSEICMRSEEDFAEAVRVCLPHLRPIDDSGFVAFRLVQTRGSGVQIASRFPREALQLLEATVGPTPRHPPYQLSEALDCIAEADRSLRQAPSWRRLLALTNPS